LAYEENPDLGDEAMVLAPAEAARWAARAGLSLAADRHAAVAAGADYFRSLFSVLRELDLGDTPPAVAPHAEEDLDAAL
jgi:hypothetical protein